MSAMQFNLLTFLGLKEHHYLLDIGCGSLRAGRLFIPYLLPGRYFGIEPEDWLLQEGIEKEIGRSMIDVKRPSFSANREFRLSAFGQKFDFIIARSIFSHATQEQITMCVAEAQKTMNRDAIFVASYFQGTRNYSGNQWTVKATYTPQRMVELVKEGGLHCEPLDWPHTDLQHWIAMTHPDVRLELAEMTSTSRVLQLEGEVDDLRRQCDLLRNHTWTKIGLRLRVINVFLEFKQRDVVRAIRRQL
jgi:hypothetical protein